MHSKARGKLSVSPTKSELDHDIIERIRQIEAAAILRGGAPDPALLANSVQNEDLIVR